MFTPHGRRAGSPGAPNTFPWPLKKEELAAQELRILMCDPLVKEKGQPMSTECLCVTLQ